MLHISCGNRFSNCCLCWLSWEFFFINGATTIVTVPGPSKNTLIDKKSLLQIPWLAWSTETQRARTKRYKKSWTNWRNSNVNKMNWPRKLMKLNVTLGMPSLKMMLLLRLPMSPSVSFKETSPIGPTLVKINYVCFVTCKIFSPISHAICCWIQMVGSLQQTDLLLLEIMFDYYLQGECAYHGSSGGRDYWEAIDGSLERQREGLDRISRHQNVSGPSVKYLRPQILIIPSRFASLLRPEMTGQARNILSI